MTFRHGQILTSVAAAGTLFAAACAVTPVTDPSEAASGSYNLDPGHSTVTWTVSHSGFSDYTGNFDEISGSLDWDNADPTQSQVDITIAASSVDVPVPPWETTWPTKLANEAFKAEEHPEITFVSNEIEMTGDNTGRITGDLTLAGETGPVTLDVTFNGTAMPGYTNGKSVLGFSALGTIDRTQWGVDNWTGFGIGESVDLIIQAEFQGPQD